MQDLETIRSDKMLEFVELHARFKDNIIEYTFNIDCTWKVSVWRKQNYDIYKYPAYIPADQE